MRVHVRVRVRVRVNVCVCVFVSRYTPENCSHVCVCGCVCPGDGSHSTFYCTQCNALYNFNT